MAPLIKKTENISSREEKEDFSQKIPTDVSNITYRLSKRAYEKLINYCRANKLDLREDKMPAYCKNRARKSSRGKNQETDFKRLVKVLETVEECSWYWGNLSGSDARKVLNNAPSGTFLLRDSSDPR